MIIDISSSDRFLKVKVEGAIDVTSAPSFHEKMNCIDTALIDRVEIEYQGEMEQFDDLTMLCLACHPPV